MNVARFFSLPLLVLLALAPNLRAQLTISNMTRYQVIQRDSTSSTATYTVTGTCRSGTANIQMQLSYQDSNKVVAPFSWLQLPSTISGTTFSATATGLPVGGEYKVQFHAVDQNNTLLDSATLQNILVGDIWLCAGQSNLMAGTTNNADSEHTHARVIMYNSTEDFTNNTRNDTSHWAKTKVLGGPCLAFGNKIYSMTGVPVGILWSASAGSGLLNWDTALFIMTKRFVTQSVNWKLAGFLWYQGENEQKDSTWASHYMTMFDTIFVDTLRARSGRPHLPIIAVQLESWTDTGTFATTPYGEWLRWPVIRNQQELIGSQDAWSASAPIWDATGLHISNASQAILGPRCAAAAISLNYANSPLKGYIGPGPSFKKAWYTDLTHSKIVVQFQNVVSRITNPADPNHLGFFVMKPGAFDSSFAILDSTALDYGTTLAGKAVTVLKNITSVDTMGTDKVVITLTTPSTDSLTVGYGRHINLSLSPNVLTPVTDSTGIPLRTFLNRPILDSENAVVTAVKEVRAGPPVQELLSLKGSLLQVRAGAPGPVSVSIYAFNGRLVRKFSTLSRSVDLRQGLGKGLYLVRAAMMGKQIRGRIMAF